jgi:hypothetical protein
MGARYAAVHMYKVFNIEAKISTTTFSKSSKHLLFLSLHMIQNRNEGTIFHTMVLLVLPKDHQTGKKIWDPSRHDPSQPETAKDHTPQG